MLSKEIQLPPPRNDSFWVLCDSQYFSGMDLASGYWCWHPVDHKKCASIYRKFLFESTRMPQVLFNAPATFQWTMVSLLGDLKMSWVLAYLNDITVLYQIFQYHLPHLWLVFNWLRLDGLNPRPSKCKFSKQEMKFLGHQLEKEGYAPLPEKVDAIDKMYPSLAFVKFKFTWNI